MALLVAKMYKRPITMEDMQAVSTLFLDRKATSRSLNQLKARGFVMKHEDGTWQITQKGINYVYESAQRSMLAEDE